MASKSFFNNKVIQRAAKESCKNLVEEWKILIRDQRLQKGARSTKAKPMKFQTRLDCHMNRPRIRKIYTFC